MDTKTILAGLKHPNYNARYSAISSLRASICDNKGSLDASTLNKIFICLSNLLLDENWSVIQATILLLGELAPEILDLPAYISIILPNLITNLGNIKGVIRRSTLSTLVIFVKQLYSAELVLNTLISVGFMHNDARVRQGSILVIPQIIGPDTNGINLKLLLKSLIFRLMDENPNVIMSTQQSIAYLSKIRKKEFSKIQNNLDHESFTILTQHNHDIHNALLQQFQDSISYEEIQRFSNIHFKNHINQSNTNNITLFQIIKPNQLSNLLHNTRRHDWENACNVAQDICISIENFCSQHQSVKSSQNKKTNDLKQLILFSCRFLEIDSPLISDQSQMTQKSSQAKKINETEKHRFVKIFLKILEKLINFDKNVMMNFAPYFIPRLVELMSYSPSKMNIVGKKSLEICKKLYLQSTPSNCGIIIQSFVDVLQQTCDIIREPIIKNIITLLLHHEHIQSSNSVDFQIIINNLSKVLNQAKSKLAYLIIELFAVMHHRLGLSLLTMLQNSTINANDMNILRERFKTKKLPILTKDGNINFRHKNMNNNNKNDQLFHHSVGSSGHVGYAKLAQMQLKHKNTHHNNRRSSQQSSQSSSDAISDGNISMTSLDSFNDINQKHTQNQQKRHSKPSRNVSASRKIPFLSSINDSNSSSSSIRSSIQSNNGMNVMIDDPGSPNSLRSEPLLQRRNKRMSNDNNALSIDTKKTRRSSDQHYRDQHKKVFGKIQSAPVKISYNNIASANNYMQNTDNHNNDISGISNMMHSSYNSIPSIPQRTHSAPMHHRHAAIAGHLSLLKKRKARATSAHSSNMGNNHNHNQQQSLSNNRAKSFGNLHNASNKNDHLMMELDQEISSITTDHNSTNNNNNNNDSSNSYTQQYYKQQRYSNSKSATNNYNRNNNTIMKRNDIKRSSANSIIRISTQHNKHNRTPTLRRQSSDGSSTSDAVYTPSDQLEMCQNPEREVKNVTKYIQSKQWDERFSALNTIRKLSYHHKEILSPHLIDLCRYIGIEINSLRSSLSRIAIITVTDLFLCFGRKLETNKIIDSLIPNLMRRAGEMSNEFISSAADKAFYAMIDNISTQKSLNILLSHSKSKSPPIRSKVAMYLEKLVSVAGISIFNYRDYERLIKTIGNFLNDGAVNTRNYAKRTIVRLNELNKSNTKNKSDFDRKLKSYLSLQQYTKVQSVLAHSHEINLNVNHTNNRVMSPKFKKPLLRSSLTGSAVINDIGNNNDSNNDYHRVRDVMTRSITINNRENIANSTMNNQNNNEEIAEKYNDAYSNLNSTDWKKRLRGLDEVAELSESAKEYTSTHIVNIMDRVSEKLIDSNGKVAICAINNLRNMVQKQHIRVLLPKILNIISEPLCTNLAAANPSIRKNSEEAINEIMVIAEPMDVVQNISQIVTFSNSRIKSHCLPKLTDSVFKMKININMNNKKVINQILTNSVCPSIASILDISKSSTQSDLRKLVRIVHSIIGKEMFTCKNMRNLRKDQLQKLENMVNR